MAKLSLVALKSYVANVVTAAKVSNGTFSVTRDNVVELVDKIGKLVTLDTAYQIDKLALFDGEYLSFGKTIEEWQADLIMVQDYDPSGAGALSPHVSTFRPNFYSYTLGKKVIKQTIRNNDLERAVHFIEQFNEIVSMMIKRMSDSMAAYRYDCKRAMLGRFIDLVEGCYSASATTFVASTAYNVGTVLKDGSIIKIPLTKTSYVRRFCKNAMFQNLEDEEGKGVLEDEDPYEELNAEAVGVYPAERMFRGRIYPREHAENGYDSQESWFIRLYEFLSCGDGSGTLSDV